MRWIFKDRVLAANEGLVELHGQWSRGYSSVILRFPQEGEYELMIRLLTGTLRVNHMSFLNMELGFGNPPRGQPAHYDLSEAGTHVLTLTIGQSFERVDQMSLVNPRWKQTTSFHYQLLRLEGKL